LEERMAAQAAAASAEAEREEEREREAGAREEEMRTRLEGLETMLKMQGEALLAQEALVMEQRARATFLEGLKSPANKVANCMVANAG